MAALADLTAATMRCDRLKEIITWMFVLDLLIREQHCIPFAPTNSQCNSSAFERWFLLLESK